MSLKQIKKYERIIFLKLFTAEVINNLLAQNQIEKNIILEKTRQKLVKPAMSPEEAFKKITRTSVIPFPRNKEQKLQENQENLNKRKLIMHRTKTPLFIQRKPVHLAQKPLQTQPPKNINTSSAGINTLKTTKPEAQQKPEGFDLGKLEIFIRDPLMQSIECPGPNKNLFVKKRNKTQVTNTTLTQEEITEIIKTFSEYARIPPIRGILKAAVGDLIISAIISEVVGSRFIINQITPYSIIEN